eukprot:CAMPEP_0119011576 /NCGR_PEP_ID=MMETSP1176-20130426/5766_1 /TAXON_ID=265551 /ORGANISM="Synedropsis recta cf, Strain CCMP1620" /LENGTH=162 /DNA_ID=CAMNT_0006964425 /DNA_START=71 /DNA_END=559 /DNA_ORIENTATION=+
MKSCSIAITLLLASGASAFAPAFASQRTAVVTERSMFSGGGDGALLEDDDPEKMKAMEEAAKSMGMSVGEYQLGMKARMKFEKEIGDMRYSGGNDDIGVEVDGKAPADHMVVKISSDGKAKGKDAVNTELTAAFKTVSEAGKNGRAEAQKGMMQYIQEQMKG